MLLRCSSIMLVALVVACVSTLTDASSYAAIPEDAIDMHSFDPPTNPSNYWGTITNPHEHRARKLIETMTFDQLSAKKKHKEKRFLTRAEYSGLRTKAHKFAMDHRILTLDEYTRQKDSYYEEEQHRLMGLFESYYFAQKAALERLRPFALTDKVKRKIARYEAQLATNENMTMEQANKLTLRIADMKAGQCAPKQDCMELEQGP